jgi:hypothetical protein
LSVVETVLIERFQLFVHRLHSCSDTATDLNFIPKATLTNDLADFISNLVAIVVFFISIFSQMKKLLLTVTICGALITAVSAQDPNFSQFFASPLTLNPALTGKFDGVYRVAGNYRNQWPTIYNAFTTYTASDAKS